jgi:uncharacterized delta-60 repeat protein
MILKSRNLSNNRLRLLLVLLFVTSLFVSVYPVFPAPAHPAAQESITSNPGDLDPTFGNGGIVTTAVSPDSDTIRKLAIQPDGKIVAVGWTGVNGQVDSALARYTTSGDLDPTFGNGGVVITAVGSMNDHAQAVALLPDGKILVTGSTDDGGGHDLVLARYTISGMLDTAFGVGGVVTTSIGAGYDAAFDIALQPDGKIVVTGYTDNGTDNDLVLARFTPTGDLDSTFGNGGVVTTAIGPGDNYGWALALQPDGKIVVAGYADNGSDSDFALVRYTTSGDLDSTFGSGGVVITAISSGSDGALTVALQPDGKIVAAGFTYNENDKDMVLVRYTDTGELDTSFGNDGIVITALGTSDDERAYGLVLQPDGKIVLAGDTRNAGDYDFVLARYGSSGELDASFGSGGIVTTSFGPGSFDRAYDVALQFDGKLVVVGVTNTGGDNDFALARYHAYPTYPIYLPHVTR